MPLALGNPQGLWLLGLLGPLLLLYVLKVRRQRVRVASTWLWQAAARDMLARSPWQRLRARWLLLLEVMALTALGLALTRPTLSGAGIDSEHVALVLDVSASMQTEVAGHSRFEAARAAGERVLGALSPGADVLLIEAGSEPRVVGPADRDLSRVRTRLSSLAALGVEGHLDRAIVLASEQLSQRAGSRRIVVISDANGLSAPLPQTKVPISIVKVGQAVDNAAIVRLDVGRAQDGATRRDRVEVFAEVRSFGSAARDVFVTLKQRGSPTVLASRKLRLEPEQKAPVVLGFDVTPGDSGTGLVVELSPHDALIVDDSAFGRVPPSRKLTTITTPPHYSPWFERALLADPDLELLGVPLAELGSSSIDDDAFVVVGGACPAQIPGGDFLILNPPAGACHGAVVGPTLSAPVVTSWDRTDPRLRFISLDGVSLAKARSIDAPSPQSVLLRGREGALAVDLSSGGRTGTLLGFDVGETNWPLRASFVLFVRNLAEIARAHRASRVVGPARSGSPLRVRVPVALEQVTLTDPAGIESQLDARGGIAVVPQPSRPGFYLVSYQGDRPGVALSVVNLTSARESDLRDHVPGDVAGSVQTGVGTRAPVLEPPTDWGFVAAALALLLVVIEVVWLTRTPAKVESRRIRPLRPERQGAA